MDESYSLDNSYSVSRPGGDSLSGANNADPSSSSSPSTGLKLRLVREKPPSTGNERKMVTPVSVKNRPKHGIKNGRGSSSSLTSLSSKKRNQSLQQSSNKRKSVALPPCVGQTTNRDDLIKLPEKEADLYVGDIIWSKMTGYPWWPCMITLDPQTRLYSQVTGSNVREFHLQFFGSKPFRGYMPQSSTMPFEGREKYELEYDRIKNTPGSQKAHRKQMLAKLLVKPNFKKDWILACAEAEAALAMDRETRIKELTFDYFIVHHTENAPKAKEDSTPKAKKVRKSENPLNVYDFDEGDEDFSEDGGSPFPWRQKRANGDFNVYLARNRSETEAKNPDLSEAEILKRLEAEWSLMSPDLKAKYIIRETSEKDEKPKKEGKTPKKTPNKRIVNTTTPQNRKRKQSELKPRTPKPTGQTNGDITTNDGHSDLSDEESALVIAEPSSPKKGRTKSKATTDSVKRPAKPLKDTISKKTTNETKVTKTPRSTKIAKAPKQEPESEPPKDIDVTAKPKSTAKRKGAKEDSKDQVSSRKRSSSVKDLEKPKRPMKQINKEDSLKTDEKKKNGNIILQQPPSIESEETRTSEDASSLSEVDSAENKETVERICAKCNEVAENYIQCSGSCLSFYHNDKDCLPSDFNSQTNQCHECDSGEHLCFICQKHAPQVKKCSDSNCGKFYHFKCLQNNYPHRMLKDENGEGFICPLHLCLTCYVEHQDDQVHRYLKKRVLKCLKCPTAYHFTDNCLAAGSVSVSHSYIICPEHIPSKNKKHVNVNWCFSCNEGGSLVCCERCPSAFHQSCLETTVLDGSFFCGDCQVRKQLHYGDIVWVKLGKFRWWPGKVCHPKNVPDNVINLRHYTGEFPVYFFGSHDYYWIHRGKAFHFVEGDIHKAPSIVKGKDQRYQEAISEALEAFVQWQEAKRDQRNNCKIKPPPYTPLRANKRVGKARPQPSDDETSHTTCSCKSESINPCGVDEDCFNRLTLIECDPSRCEAGDKCQNRRFKKREYAKVIPFKTESRGWGLKSLQDIKKGQFVIEYVGELIDEAECETRIKNMIDNKESNFYFLTIDRETIIDAGPKGNMARFMNHSCSPNCETQKWVVNGNTRVGLFAIQDIPEGSELTFNYNLHCRGNEKTKCDCGAKNCSGFLGVRPKQLPEEESTKKPGKAEAKKKKPDPKIKAKKAFESFHEDECFKCGEGGELVMCDKKKCPKSYHIACLNLAKLPRGQWFCPWHHCDQCGKPSTRLCHVCPTSFCSVHGQDMLTPITDGSFLCYDHSGTDASLDETKLAVEHSEPDASLDETKLAVENSGTDASLEETKVAVEHSETDASLDETKVAVEHSGTDASLDEIKLAVEHSGTDASLDETKVAVEHSGNDASLDETKLAVENSGTDASLEETKVAVEHSETDASLDETKVAVEHSGTDASLDETKVAVEHSEPDASLEETKLAVEHSEPDASLEETKLVVEHSEPDASLEETKVAVEHSGNDASLDETKLAVEHSGTDASLDKTKVAVENGSVTEIIAQFKPNEAEISGHDSTSPLDSKKCPSIESVESGMNIGEHSNANIQNNCQG